jgi:hypothetical protein
MKRMACVLALATGTGLAFGVAGRPAAAAPLMAEPTALVADGFQIAVASMGAVSDDAAVALEVRYRGGNVASIELTIDGQPVKKRALTTRNTQGMIRFALDPGTLGEGDHLISISATDRDGNTSTTTTQIHVTAGDPNSLANLMSPKKNSMVQGLVPIEVKIDESIHRPFVSFYVDQDFAVVNFAPFTYNWDSTRATNGPHTVGIEVIDGDTQAIVKRFSVVVNVNNPGGFTNRQTTIPDLNHKSALKTEGLKSNNDRPARIVEAVRAAGTMAVPSAHFDASGLDNTALHTVRPLSDLQSDLHEVLPQGNLVLPVIERTAISRPDHTVPAAHFAGTYGAATRPGALGLFANPHEMLHLDQDGLEAGTALHVHAKPRRVGNFAAMPDAGLSVTTIATQINTAPVNAHVKPVFTTHTKRAIQTALVGGGALNSRGGAFEVAFDNTRIAFDVPPRVEHGLPLAPFRQIFEHAGGTVRWYNQSQTVRAYNATREIEFKVGQKTATVNNHAVKMDAKSYVDHGRTIVPLTFVRDALNVTVQYDAATGHLRIESRH